MNSKVKVDNRSVDDLYKEMQELTSSYTPEWSFDTQNPDIGSTIGMIFANQMHDNIKKTNLILDRYRVEFVNLLDLSLLPAIPAEGTVIMDMISGTVDGTYIQRGTKLLGESQEDGESIIFETAQTMYVTGAEIDNILAISRTQGKIISYKGEISEAPMVRTLDEAVAPEEVAENESQTEHKQMDSLYLFDYRKSGIAKNALIIYHDTAFDIGLGGKIMVRLQNLESDLYEHFVDQNFYQWSYYKDGKFNPFGEVQLQDDNIVLWVSEQLDMLGIGGRQYQCIAIECMNPVIDSVSVEKLEMASETHQIKPEFICFENTELDIEKFMPFGEVARQFSECYIGENKIFGQKGAEITMELELSLYEKLVTMTPEEEDAELKIIKRKPRKIQYDMAKAAIQKVIFEYFNSKGWVKLECNDNYEELFDGSTEGKIAISFKCPEDLDVVSIGGFEGKVIRIRVLQADNCYLQPCIHTMPVISNLTLSYEYLGAWRMPVFLDKITGTYKTDISKALIGQNRTVIFEPLSHERESFLIGLSKKPKGEPFSLLFSLEDNANYNSQNITFEYSSLEGFKRLKVIDLTDGLRKTGLVLVITPSDFARIEIENTKKFWIRIVDEATDNHKFDGSYPKINQIYLNGINIVNKETKMPIDFFIDNIQANMSFQLPYANILESEVYVNEKGTLPLTEINAMIENEPERVKSENDYLGNLRAFYVKWQEVENFDQSQQGDRHYVLNRMTNRLHFGDGIHVRIPQVSNDVAFSVQVMCCDGAKANLPVGNITNAQGRLLYIGSINNPIATFGGSDIERPDGALERAAGIISSKNRLVSNLDFERAAKANFSQIQATKCVNGINPNGSVVNNEITMVVLTKEYLKGTYAFESIAEKLRKKLLANNEFVLNKINVIEPTFVKLEAIIWINTEDYEHIFEIQNKFIEELNDFIDPINGCYGNGWDIGRLPTVHQLRMIMKRAESGAVVKQYIITATYRDASGCHEVDFKDLKGHPFMVCINGEHKVVIENFN